MANKTYSELLKDPRWQKKRLEIMQRDDFKCLSCGRGDQMLAVHHVRYTAKDIWNEKSENLITLCDDCHKVWHHTYGAGYDPNVISLVVDLFDSIVQKEVDREMEVYYKKYPEARNNNNL